MASKIPSSYRKLLVTKLTNRFREATEVVTATGQPPAPNEVLVQNRFVGINASDINFSAGRYDPRHKPPLDCGFEGVGTVVAAGEKSGHQVGQAVLYMANGAFSEYITLPGKIAIPMPKVSAEFVPFMVSGLTAALALDKVGEIKAGNTVLVTAAAGGTGQFAVQWAKNAGCHVIGTCSSPEKVEFLKSIGCDRAVNYKTENLWDVLKAEYPNGLDVVYESIGGDMFNTAVDRLAFHGKVIIIGYISGYESSSGINKDPKIVTLPPKLLSKSASVRGFLLFHYAKDYAEYLGKLTQLYSEGKIKSATDNGINAPNGPFKGLDSIANGVDYLYSGKSVGKIVVEMGLNAKL